MSVLIKGLEMPTTCTMCWLNTFCGVWNTEPVKHKGFNERLENCPLTELIRCRDCYFYGTFQRKHYCTKYEHTVKKDRFCAWAEPKDSTAEVRRQLKEQEQRKEMERKK